MVHVRKLGYFYIVLCNLKIVRLCKFQDCTEHVHIHVIIDVEMCTEFSYRCWNGERKV